MKRHPALQDSGAYMNSLVTDYLCRVIPQARCDDILQPVSPSGRVGMTVHLTQWEGIASQRLLFSCR